MSRFDVVIVGGGSAGCVVAAKLSEDPRRRVLLIERGGPAEDNPEVLRADGYKDAFINDDVVWHRLTVPQQALNRRRIFCGTGTGMGGSGSINGMVYTRGDRRDFDAWPEGWRWQDLVGAFEGVEAVLDPHRRPHTAWTNALLDAAAQSDFTLKDDLNDGELGGVMGAEWMNYRGDQRRSSYVAFLAPVLERDNLTVWTRCDVRRIRFEGTRAVGVEVARRGSVESVDAGDEVIVCAGALASPAVLLRSGVGPADALRALDLPVVADVPGVGRNLHDHPNVVLLFRGPRPVDAQYPQIYGFDRMNPSLPLAGGAPDTCFVGYPARSSFREGLMRLLPTMALPPSLQEVPIWRGSVRGMIRGAFTLGPLRRMIEATWGIVVVLGKPVSRGAVTLASADPRVPPLVDPGYLRDPRDLSTLIHGVRRAVSIARAEGLRDWLAGPLLPPWWLESDRAIERFIRQQAITTYHFAGTCQMGTRNDAVVDLDLRVRGTHNLRVIDASVFPSAPVAALNAPSMALAYKAVTG